MCTYIANMKQLFSPHKSKAHILSAMGNIVGQRKTLSIHHSSFSLFSLTVQYVGDFSIFLPRALKNHQKGFTFSLTQFSADNGWKINNP